MKEIKERWTAAKFIRPNDTILDFTGLYEVSSLGRVRSLNYLRTCKIKVLSQYTNKAKDGSIYYTLVLCKDNKHYTLPVHRLVLSSFRPEGTKGGYFLGAVCNHKKERSHTSCINELWNLEWITQKDNVNTEHCKTLKSKSQINHPARSKRVKVTNLTTREVTVYPSAMEAGRALGINPKVPSMCIKQSKGFHKKLGLHFAYV